MDRGNKERQKSENQSVNNQMKRSTQKLSYFDLKPEQADVTSYPYLDLSEVHWFADEFIVLGQLLARWQLDEDLTQLSAITAETRSLSSVCVTVSQC